MTLSTGTLRVGILAILAGLVGAYVIQSVLTSKPVVETPPPANIQVPLAAANLPEGRIVTLGDIAYTEMTPAQFRQRGTPAGMVMMDPQQIIGRRLRETLTENQFFTTNLFYLENDGPDITAKLKPGFRAYSMMIPDVRGGAVNPGSTVDVIFRTVPRPATATSQAIPEMTVTLLQSIDVIHVERPRAAPAAGRSNMLDLRRGGNQGPSPPTVTLAVTSDQAKVLQTVMGHGEISLSPWSPKDSVEPPISAKKGTTLEDILGIEPPVPPQPVVVTPPFVTETWRRGAPDVRAYNRDGIFVWASKKPLKPDALPAPNPLPQPLPAVNPMGANPMGAKPVVADPLEKPADNAVQPEKVELPKP